MGGAGRSLWEEVPGTWRAGGMRVNASIASTPPQVQSTEESTLAHKGVLAMIKSPWTKQATAFHRRAEYLLYSTNWHRATRNVDKVYWYA